MDELISKWKASGREAVEYLEEHASKLAPEAFQSNRGQNEFEPKRRRFDHVSEAWQAVYEANDRIIQQEKEDKEQENEEETADDQPEAPEKPVNPMEEWLLKVKAILE